MALFKHKKVTGKDKVGLVIVILLGVVLSGILLLYGNDITVLNPKGPIAEKQRSLIILASLLSLVVVLPVFALTFGIAWKYRAGNHKARYMPEWDGGKRLESIWWGIPMVLILILSVIIYKSSHDLDPFRPVAAARTPLTIQVVALQWKWLFIYPEQGIATLNFVQFPEDRPVNFEITADAPMNSFWIPSLGGQIYAMAGMSTQLHLLANEPGDFRGSSANLSGAGFADMKFVARASTSEQFDRWVISTKQSPDMLDMNEYHRLAEPDRTSEKLAYVLGKRDLYTAIIGSYMQPNHNMGRH